MGGDLRVVALFFCRFFGVGVGGTSLKGASQFVSLADSLFGVDGVRTRSALIKNEGVAIPRTIFYAQKRKNASKSVFIV